MAQLFVGIMAEGPTDYRFLKPIIENTLVDFSFQCNTQIDISVFDVKYAKDGFFTDYAYSAAKNGFEEFGIMILIIHADADSLSKFDVYKNKITPSIEFIKKSNDPNLCKNIAPVVPVYETESWMLADKELFKRKISTKKTDSELNINGNPETFNNPKERIESAIRIGRMDLPKKLRNTLKIEDMYSLIGEELQISKLEALESFKDFKKNIKQSFEQLSFF